MLNNEESPAPTLNGQNEPENNSIGQRETVHNMDLESYVKRFQSCNVSKQTATFMACVKVLSDLSGLVRDGLVMYYGEVLADRVFNEQYEDKMSKIEDTLNDILVASIQDKIECINFEEI